MNEVKELSLTDLRALSPDDLKSRESDLRGHLFQLKMTKHTSTIANPMQIRRARRDIARVLTVLGERVTGSAAARPSAGAKE